MSKRYYWLKLKEDFFKQLPIKKLRSIAGGDTYTIIYLKMMLYSINNNGRIEFEGTDCDLAKNLAFELDENYDNVVVTISFLKSQGLMVDCGINEATLSQVSGCIGSETSDAKKQREYRERKTQKYLNSDTKTSAEMLESNKNGDNVVTNVTLDIREKDIRDGDIRGGYINNRETHLALVEKYEKNIGTVSSNMADLLNIWLNEYGQENVEKAIDIVAKGIKDGRLKFVPKKYWESVLANINAGVIFGESSKKELPLAKPDNSVIAERMVLE